MPAAIELVYLRLEEMRVYQKHWLQVILPFRPKDSAAVVFVQEVGMWKGWICWLMMELCLGALVISCIIS